MSTKFYTGQKDYIAKLNELDDLFTLATGNPATSVAAAAAATDARDVALAAATAAQAARDAANAASTSASTSSTNVTQKAAEAVANAQTVATQKAAVDIAANAANQSAIAADASKAAAAASASSVAGSSAASIAAANDSLTNKNASAASAAAAFASKTDAANSTTTAINAAGGAAASEANALASKNASTTNATAAVNAASAAAADRLLAVKSAAAVVINKDITLTKANEASVNAAAAATSASNAQGFQNTAQFHAVNAAALVAAAVNSAAAAGASADRASHYSALQVASTTASGNSANQAAASAATIQAIYGTTNSFNDQLNTAKAQVQLAQTAASSASSVLSQDLSAVSLALHRSPNAVTAMFLYDTSKDTDEGAWVERMQHTSWANEPLAGAWLPGGFATELLARGDNLTFAAESLEVWTAQTNAVITTNVATAPDGTLTADKYEAISNESCGAFLPIAHLNIANTYAASVHLKPISGRWFQITYYDGNTNQLRLFIDLTNRVVTSGVSGNSVVAGAAIELLEGGWCRVSIAGTQPNSVGYIQINAIVGNGDSTPAIGSCYVWGTKLNQVGVSPATYNESPELVVNGGFDNGTLGVTAYNSANIINIGGVLRVTNDPTAPSFGGAGVAISAIIGRVYSLNVSALGGTSNGAYLTIGTTNGGSEISAVANGGNAGFTVVFIATATTIYFGLSVSGNTASQYRDYDNVSCKEVTTLATPYVPYSTQTNSYYQSSADGKFYKLGATYGALTEVFRGNTAKFPRLAMLVAESGNVSIYDLTAPGCPMWMVLRSDIHFWDTQFNRGITSLAAMQGKILVGVASVSGYSGSGLTILDYASGDLLSITAGDGYFARGKKSGFTSTNGIRHFNGVHDAALFNLADYVINAIAITVLPNAPFDVATGLQVPTIAVATDGGGATGVSIINHDGIVVIPPNTYVSGNISFNAQGDVVVIGENSTNIRRSIAPLYTSTVGQYNGPLALTSAAYSISSDYALKAVKNLMAISARTGGVYFLRDNPSNLNKYIAAQVAKTFNTGYMIGDIRRAYLCDTGVESINDSNLVTGDNATFTNSIGSWLSLNWPTTLSTPGGVLRVVQKEPNARASLRVPTVVNKSYEISGDVRWVSGPNAAGFGAGFTGESNATFAADTLSTTFVRRTLILTATSTEMCVIAGINGGGTSIFEYDNISVKEAIPNRSYKTAATSIYGTLVKYLVA